jgi:hypothetical protein
MVEPEIISIAVLDVAALAQDHEVGVADLTERLRSAGVPVFAQGQRQFVPQVDWQSFVRNAIRAFPGVGRIEGLRPAADEGRVRDLHEHTGGAEIEYADLQADAQHVRSTTDLRDEARYTSEYEIGHGEWDDAEREQLRRNPRQRMLLDQFTRCSEQRLNARWRQNRTTRTFYPDEARKFGLKLGGSLFIYRVSGNDKRGMYLRSEADFDKAMDWAMAAKKSPWQSMGE